MESDPEPAGLMPQLGLIALLTLLNAFLHLQKWQLYHLIKPG